MATQTADPVSIEIHRKALENITNEMAIALTRTSGSPVVYEVQDFATSLADVNGEQLAMSATILLHSGSSLLGTLAIIEKLNGETPRECLRLGNFVGARSTTAVGGVKALPSRRTRGTGPT